MEKYLRKYGAYLMYNLVHIVTIFRKGGSPLCVVKKKMFGELSIALPLLTAIIMKYSHTKFFFKILGFIKFGRVLDLMLKFGVHY